MFHLVNSEGISYIINELLPHAKINLSQLYLDKLMCVHAWWVTSVVSDSVQPYGVWPARFLCPWDFAGKNTGVGCHAPPPGDLPHSGIEPPSLVPPALAGRFFTTSATWEAQKKTHIESKFLIHIRAWI